ncbi:MAG TPA: hypothetical protein DCL15_19175 [Chloroflexi bacterium]|nr:hypothetical protein [Chloroflexota bacterium]HHW85842.1 hypothetical protein [Chloroflexota bacterium]
MSPSISVPKTSVRLALCLALLLLPAVVLAQSGSGYNLEWNTIDGGGHTFSSGGVYSVGGTIGQPDAGSVSGENYTLAGGFWGLAGGFGGGGTIRYTLYLPLILRQ